MKKTKQNQLILDIVNNSYSHPTAQEIYSKARDKMPNISLGTVYRNLGFLVDSEDIKKIPISDGIDRYDKNIRHSHFICSECNHIYDIADDIIVDFSNVKDSIVSDYELILKGLCKTCIGGGDKNGIKR